MKFAISYVDTFRHFNEVDEVIFNYNETDDLVSLITSKLKNQEQKAIIALNEVEQELNEILPILLKIQQEHSNMAVIIDFFEQREWIDTLQENEINFIFSDYARNLSVLAAMYRMGASEVYLAEDICFNLRKLQTYRSKGLKFRIWPDIAQLPAGTKKVLEPLSGFFVRPEDVSLYEKLVDTMEFMRSGTQVNVTYEVYQRGQWLGHIEDIILDLDVNLDNSTVVPLFGTQRLGCQKRCLLFGCDVCDRTQELAEAFDENDIGFVKKKNKPRIPKEIENMITKGEENGFEADKNDLFQDNVSIAEDADTVSDKT